MPTSNHPVVVQLSSRLDELVAAIVGRVDAGERDPFTAQLVVTPGPAHHRYVSQAIATANGHGICAGVDLVTLAALRRRWLGHFADDELPAPDDNRWVIGSLSRALMQVMDECLGEPWAAQLARHLGDREQRPGRRLATAERFARLISRYCDQAPAMIDAWDAGHFVGPDAQPLASAEQWQPELFTRVSALVGQPHPLAQHRLLIDRLATGRPDGLPDQINVLVTDILSSHDQDLLVAAGTQHQVFIGQLHHPPSSAAPTRGPSVLPRQARVHELALTQWRSRGVQIEQLAPARQPEPTSGLSTLQAVMRGDQPPVTGQISESAPAAFTWLPSHGPNRQVEVLRDHLCGLFEDDPSLEPRDVVVLCPRLDEEYASLLDAMLVVPGLTDDAHPGRELRVSVSQSSPRPNEVLNLLVALLGLRGTRATWLDLLNLCLSTPVATRFGFGVDAGQQVRRLVEKADIRWGVDLEHRRSFGVDFAGGTWYAGVQRLANGAALADTPLTSIGTLAPASAVDSQAAELGGRLAEFISRVRLFLHQARTATPAAWNELLQQTISDCFDLPPDQRWQIGVARSALAAWAGADDDQSLVTPVEMRRVVERLAADLRVRPAFGTGALLATSLEAVSAIPHRVVVVLGLDDANFPGNVAAIGDDLMAGVHLADLAEPRDLRQAHLLNAVMSAERVSIIYQAASGATLMPMDRPVAVGDLLSGAQQAGCGDRLPRVLPAQSYSVSNFIAHEGDDGEAEPPFSFDQRAARRHRGPATALVDPSDFDHLQHQLLQDYGPTPSEPVVNLDDLTTFFAHPLRAFLKGRAGFSLRANDELPTSVTLTSSGLTWWSLRDQVRQRLMAGEDPQQLRNHFVAVGLVPPTSDGVDQVDQALNDMVPVVERELADTTPRRQVPIDLMLDTPLGPRRLVGSVESYGSGYRSAVTAKRMGGKHLLAAWIPTLALAAQTGGPPQGLVSLLTSQQPLALAGQHSAEQELADLVMLAELGLRYPFPAPLKTLWEDLINEGHGARAKDKWADERDEDWALFLPESWWRASSMSAHVPHRASGEIDTVSVAALAGRLFGGIQLGKVQPCRP